MDDLVAEPDPRAVFELPERRRPATFEALRKKPRREKDVVVQVPGDDGRVDELVLRYRAIGGKEYDDLVAAHPPTRKQRDEGANYNIDSFAPALISRVCVDPVLSYDEAHELFHSPDWAAGEAGGLFIEALRICNAGLDVPFNELG